MASSSSAAPVDLQLKMIALQSRITKERKLLEGYQALRSATTNNDVIRSCEAKMRESTKSIGWFEESLREIEARSSAASCPGSSSGNTRERSLPTPPGSASAPGGNGGAAGGINSYQQQSQQQQQGRLPATGTTRSSQNDRQQIYADDNARGRAQSEDTLVMKPKVVFSNLDLIKADTPLTSAKISRMLHQLEFKLHVEKQYKEGIDKMAKLYQVDGDKKARADTENKRIESNQKMLLLSQALKRYKTLDVMGDLDVEEDDGLSEDVKSNLRKPLSGSLQITVKSARDLAHAPQPKKSKHPSETVVYVNVEDTPRARTHLTRSDRWNEDFDINVDKANEVEVTIYDKVPGDNNPPVPIGMLWLRLSDIVEELRRRKMEADTGPGWVTAAKVKSNRQGSGGNLDLNLPGTMTSGGRGGVESDGEFGGQSTEGIDAWFAVEPEGAIFLHLNFVKSNVRKRPYDAGGLGRQGAVRKRKEEIHEQNGHKFIQKQFYTVVLCALCSEFLLKGAGMQCEDCKYACHKNCYSKVVTKCISKSSAESDKDEEKLNHRIPHRFEPITNISPNWCCHCGMVLPLGRKGARKCSECGVTAHGDCAHLVPDFCGMSMEMANRLLADIKTINSTRRSPATTTTRPSKATTLDRIASPPLQNDRQRSSDGYHGPRTTQDEYDRPLELANDVGRLALDERERYQPQGPSYPQGAGPPRPQQISPNKGSMQQQQQQRTSGEERASRSSPQYPRLDQSRPQQSQQQQPYSVPPFDPRTQQRPTGIQPGQIFQHPGTIRNDPRQQQQQQQRDPRQDPRQHQQQQSDPRLQQREREPVAAYSLPSAPSLPVALPQLLPIVAPHRKVSTRQRRVGLDDFNFLAVLGKGNFGKVMLAEEKSTSQLYAIKVLKKEFIIENDEVESTRSEKRVFLAAARERHPFLLGLHSCFQTETRIYFVMEYVSGGDLMLQIQREQFTQSRAKFYAAEVLLALEYFHQNGIVYRDLKLDNILLTLDGHIKVADYGLCKEEMWYGKTTSTFCGTPEFMAPEIILEQRYGRAVDWWAFGVLIYEMILGQSPFRGDDEDEIFEAILEDEPLYPIHMPRDQVSILTRLLKRDPLRRLGSGETDAAEIKAHPYFQNTNWDDIMNKRVPPPFYPSIRSATDTSNFDSEFTSEQPTLTPVHSTLSTQDQGEFSNFSWIAPWANEQR